MKLGFVVKLVGLGGMEFVLPMLRDCEGGFVGR